MTKGLDRTTDFQTSSIELILDRIEQVGTKDYLDSSSLKIRKVGKDRQMFGKFIIKQPLNDSVILKIGVFKKTGAGWNNLPYKIEKPICTFFLNDKYFYQDLVKVSNFPNTMPCPVPAVRAYAMLSNPQTKTFSANLQVTFEITGWNPSLENVPPMLVKNGDYKFKLDYILDSEEIFGLVAYASVINIFF